MRPAPEHEVSFVFAVCAGYLPAVPTPVLSSLAHMTNQLSANVDEVFIDLCRQMLRKEDETAEPDEGSKIDALKSANNKRRRRSKFRDSTHPRCVIL